MPHVLLLNDNSDQDNWGAHATPYALKCMLRDAIPDVTVTSLSYGWLLKQHMEFRGPLGMPIPDAARRVPLLRTVVRRFSQAVEHYPKIVDDFDYTADRWMNGAGGPSAQEFLSLAKRSNVIVHNAENGIYKNSVTGCRSLFLLWLGRTRLNRPACEVNATAHLVPTRPIMHGMVKLVFPSLDVVTVREPCSLRNLHEQGIEKAELVPDVVYYLDETERAQKTFADWKKIVGLEGRPYFCLSAGSLPMSVPRADWHGSVVDLVEKLARLGVHPVLMAKDTHCLFLQEVAKRTGATYFGPEHEFHEVWPLLREAQFLVTGHFHYIIMGAMVGCPSVPLSTNNHKIPGALEHLKWHITTPFDSTAIRYEADKICAEAQRLRAQRDHYAHQLITRSAELRSQASRNAVLIKRLLD